ncbi:hypothetical protein [uncultured Helicobacter sp.]|uniref:hypothetical protein n=1 Tax=uncultured Helicobacter sp. TaxID=175537 RepID=UPI001C3B2861|nr:hypothetical protein [Candidatus Helicobacter avicola]
MKKICVCGVMGVLMIGVMACADVQGAFSGVDKKIDDFKEENAINQKLDDISNEANKAIDDITR